MNYAASDVIAPESLLIKANSLINAFHMHNPISNNLPLELARFFAFQQKMAVSKTFI